MGVSEPYHLWVVKENEATLLPRDLVEAEIQYVDAWQLGEIDRFMSS